MFSSITFNGQIYTGVDIDNLSVKNPELYATMLLLPKKGRQISKIQNLAQTELVAYNRAIGLAVDKTNENLPFYLGRSYGQYTAKPYSGKISVSRSVRKIEEMNIFLHSEYFKAKTERMDKMVKDPNTFAETPFKDELTTLKETFTAFKTTALCLNKTMLKQSMDKIGVILLELRGKIRKYEQFLESLANQKETLRKVT